MTQFDTSEYKERCSGTFGPTSLTTESLRKVLGGLGDFLEPNTGNYWSESQKLQALNRSKHNIPHARVPEDGYLLMMDAAMTIGWEP